MTTAAPAPPRPPIDPRIRARRIAVQRDEGRRRLRRLVGLAAVAGLVAGVTGLAFSPALDVDRVLVDGAGATGAGTVVAASGIHPGHAMVTVDAMAAAAAVEQLPWVAAASVSRHWPGTVRIRVEERRAVAAVPAEGGGYVLVDARGHRLMSVGVPPPGLVTVTGLEAAGPPGGRLGPAARPALELVGLLPASLRDRVGEVRVVEGGQLDATVSLAEAGEAQVRFGPASGLAAKVLALATILDQVAPQGVAVIDVRVPGSPVLTER